MQNITSSRTDDSGIEQELQQKGLTSSRVTPKDIEDNIASIWYINTGTGVIPDDYMPPVPPVPVDNIASIWYINTGTGVIPDDYMPPVPVNHPLRLLTFCVLVLKNGFTVTGESACASPENFDAEIGRKIALENAKQRIWPLMGYELRTKLTKE